MYRNISTLVWFLCIICCESGLRFDLPRSLKTKVGRCLSDFRLRCRSDDETKSSDESEIVVESSTKALSKYETRSRLLEAALASTRLRQIELDATNSALKKEVNELKVQFELSDKGTSQIIEELEKSMSELQTALKLSATSATILEKVQQEEKKEKNMEIIKYKNRLILLEKAYRESQIALREEMDDAVEKDAIRCTQTVQISELLEETVQLKMDVEILRSDFIAKKKIMIDERDSLELVIDELNRKETKRNQDEKVAVELALTQSIKAAAIEPVKMVQSETFSDFLKRNEIEKMLEEQMIQKRNNEYLLEQQKLVLGETIRLLSSSADEVNKRKKEREREKAKEREDEKERIEEKEMKSVTQVEVGIDITKSVTEQIRLLQKQAEVLESLKSEILILNSSVTAYMLSAPKINNFDDDISSLDAINMKRNKIPNKSTEIPSFVYYDDYDMKSDKTARQPRSDFSKKEISGKNTQQPVSTSSSNKLEDGEEREEDKVNTFFSKVANFIAPPDSNNDSNDDDITDEYDIIDENKTIKKTKIGSAQQNRVKFARTSGKAIRTVGRNIMKSASDALGFWVGLGFDEIEIEGDNDKDDFGIVDENDINFIQERSSMNTNQFYTSLPPSIPNIIDIQAKENEKLRLMTENNPIEIVESAPRKVLKSPFYVQNSIKKDGI